MNNKLKSKLIYAKTREAFKREYDAGNMVPNLNPLVFIEESREFWILGNYYSIASPTVTVTEKESVINVNIGDSSFKMFAGGSLSIRKSVEDENTIVFSSTALSSVTTEYPLFWDFRDNKLVHEKSGVEETTYGPSSDSDNASYITVPQIAVDKWGHITSAGDKSVKIRDYVEQLSSSGLQGDYNILLGDSSNEDKDTGVTRKAIGLSFNPETKKLNVSGGITAGTSEIEGDFTVTGGKIIGNVEGEITGTATPKIHLSSKPEYGGASTKLYGHVKVQDTFEGVPAPSSNNDDPSSSLVENGIAASPKMVWDVKETLEGGIAGVREDLDALPTIYTINVNEYGISTKDLEGTLGIRVGGGTEAGIDPNTGEIYLQSTSLTGYDEEENQTDIKSNIKFTKDFEFVGDELSLRWAPTMSGASGDVLRFSEGAPVWTGLAQTVASTDTTGIPSAAAVFKAVNEGIATNDAMVYKGVWSDLTKYPAAERGWTFKITKAGVLGGVDGPRVELGDTIIASENGLSEGTHALVGSKWNVLQTNIESSPVGIQLMTMPNASTAAHFMKVDGSTVSYRSVTQIKDDLGISTDITNALNAFKGTDKITTVGTISTGKWQGDTVTVGYGGTGVKTLPNNSVLIGSGANPIKGVINGTDVKQFLSQTSGGEPVWSKIGTAALDTKNLTVEGSTNVTASVSGGNGAVLSDAKITVGWTGQLGVTSGGTGLSTIAANSMLYASSKDVIKAIAPGTDGYVLKSVLGVPTWSAETQYTHHVANLFVTNSVSSKANAAATDGTVRLNLVENETVRNSVHLYGGENVSITANASGKVTVSAVNTWRDVQANNISNAVVNSIGTADLTFGEEFIWNENELKLGWAEVSADGTVTYSV